MIVRKTDPVARHRARVDRTRQRFDQLRRTYSDISDVEYDAVFQSRLIYGRKAIEAGLSEAFGKRPYVERRPIAELRAEEGAGIRIIAGDQEVVLARQPHARKRELARRIRDAVLSLTAWRAERIGNVDVLAMRVGDLEILRTTNAPKAHGMPAANGIDVWIANGKVFSVWWNEPKPDDDLEIVRCDKGEWYAPLLVTEKPLSSHS